MFYLDKNNRESHDEEWMIYIHSLFPSCIMRENFRMFLDIHYRIIRGQFDQEMYYPHKHRKTHEEKPYLKLKINTGLIPWRFESEISLPIE